MNTHYRNYSHMNRRSMKYMYLTAALYATFLPPVLIARDIPESELKSQTILTTIPFGGPEFTQQISIVCGLITNNPACAMSPNSSCKLQVTYNPPLPSERHACSSASYITGFICDPQNITVNKMYYSATPWCAPDSTSSTGCKDGCADEQPNPKSDDFTYQDDDLWGETP
jgi:hypothetical protein